MSDTGNPKVADLIQRAQQGDSECRERLFALCRSYLGFAARAQVESWLKAKVDASDVVQQTMLEAHRDFSHFQGSSEQQLLAWLRKILLHNVADFVRHYRGTAKRRVGREVPFRTPGETDFRRGAPEPSAPDGTPSQEFLRRDNELRLIAALEKLPPTTRKSSSSEISSGCRLTKWPSRWSAPGPPRKCFGSGRSTNSGR